MDDETLRWLNGLSKIYNLEEKSVVGKYVQFGYDRMKLLYFLECNRSGISYQGKEIENNSGKNSETSNSKTRGENISEEVIDNGQVIHDKGLKTIKPDREHNPDSSISSVFSNLRSEGCKYKINHNLEVKDIEASVKDIKLETNINVVLYLNGFSIKNNFYSISNKENYRLYKMLCENVLDIEALEDICGPIDRDIELTVKKINIYYEESPILVHKHGIEEHTIEQMKKLKIEIKEEAKFIYVIGKGKVSLMTQKIKRKAIDLPARINIGNESCFKFTLVYKSQSSTVYVSKDTKVGDILVYLQNLLSLNVSLMLSGEILDSQEMASKFSKTVVDIYID